MADNVVEHSILGDAPRGIVAYEVAPEFFGFAVADVGQGVLASLRSNPAHLDIGTDADALLAAVTGGASRRVGEPSGRGFADLLRALADLNAVVSCRSGAARLTLDGRGAGNRKASPRNSPRMKGFQLSVRAQPSKAVWSA
jgi:hypothetical protein